MIARRLLFATIALVSLPVLAVEVLYHWEGFGKSGTFTISPEQKVWRTAWRCEVNSRPSIRLLNADDGGLVESFGGPSSGEKLFQHAGKFKWNTGSTDCKLTASTLN